MLVLRSWWLVRSPLLVLLAAWPTACSSPPRAPINLSGEGWQMRQGQAIWCPGRGQPEIAGELVTGVRGSQERLVEFVKTPFPLVIARSNGTQWELQFGPKGRRVAGRGAPPDRLIWFFLRDCLEGQSAPPPGWQLHEQGQGHWRFENRASGESLEGYLKGPA